ncbi:MAG: glutamate racemase [Phaeodactylibacter sp.]|nr:glutamate racemase [Phaeodactylibacter sp.]MCB9272619.1 glutamate racemase [Lewinellaceae bacterium]
MSQTSQPIGIFDSGIGGLSVAYAILHQLPAELLLYFGDTAHIPYGTKPASTIRRYSENICRFLLDQGCKLIVVACNTASAAALNHLRHLWPDVPIVGMEPAVKPGALATRTGKVGVLATAGTFKSQRYASLMHRFAKEVELLENPCLGLVERIEAGQLDGPETEQLLRSIINPMLAAGADAFVLGCTHYPFVQPLIEKIAGPDIAIINPAPAVARQVERLLHESGQLSMEPLPHHRFFISGKDEDGHFKRMAKTLLGFSPELISGHLI